MLSPLAFLFIGKSLPLVTIGIEPYSHPDCRAFSYCNKLRVEELDTAWL